MAYLWGLFWALFSVIFTCHTSKIECLKHKKPPIYQRYVDDMLIFANNINEFSILQDIFQKNSVLNFTHELNKKNKFHF